MFYNVFDMFSSSLEGLNFSADGYSKKELPDGSLEFLVDVPGSSPDTTEILYWQDRDAYGRAVNLFTVQWVRGASKVNKQYYLNTKYDEPKVEICNGLLKATFPLKEWSVKKLIKTIWK